MEVSSGFGDKKEILLPLVVKELESRSEESLYLQIYNLQIFKRAQMVRVLAVKP